MFYRGWIHVYNIIKHAKVKWFWTLSEPILSLRTHNIKYLDFLFTKLAAIVLKVFRLFPGALSSFQVIVVVISVFDAMFHPHTISAACSKEKNAPLNIEHFIDPLRKKMASLKHNYLEQHCLFVSAPVRPGTCQHILGALLSVLHWEPAEPSVYPGSRPQQPSC